MGESEQEQTLNIIEHRTERIEKKLDELKLELRTAAMFLVLLTMAVKTWSAFPALLVAAVISGVFAFVNSARLRKYGSF